MEHPLINNIDDLSVDDLQKQISDLNKKLSFSMRTGNAHLTGQIRMALETFNNKYQQRMQEIYEKQNRSGTDFSDKINIS
jgi:hypothetical protein